MNFDIYNFNSPEDIAGALLNNMQQTSPNTKKELIDAIYYLQAVAENPYNKDYFKTLYIALSDLADYYTLPF